MLPPPRNHGAIPSLTRNPGEGRRPVSERSRLILSRWLRSVFGLAAAFATAGALAQTAQAPTAGVQAAAASPTQPEPAATLPSAWLQAGSDIPADPAWRAGTLPNGLRFAVRNNARPAGSVSIRVRIDAGALMEGEAEQGWAHLLEHMVFRGTATVPDGEGVRIWQRLGSRFGADTNAFTSLRQTLYVLDLPRADRASLREGLRVLAEMLNSARIDPALLATERQVVLAEGAQRRSPLARRLQEANQATLLAGTKAARRDLLGTPETLGNASPDRLRAFYKRWYRPERATVAVAGDADPSLLEEEVRRAFGDWHGEGAPPAEPDYGSVAAPAHPVAVVSDPQATTADTVSWMTPHDEGPVTAARVQQRYIQAVADGVLRQRLDTASQAGGPLVSASVGRSRSRHVADQLSLGVIARPGQSRAALEQVFAILNALRAAPPAQAEIDQQVAQLRRNAIDRNTVRPTSWSGPLANELVGVVDAGEPIATPRFYYDLLTALIPAITPDAVHRVVTESYATDPRLVRAVAAGPADTASATADLAAARRVAAAAGVTVRSVSLKELPLPGPSGTIVSREVIADLGITRLRFANGVTLDYKQTPFERNTTRLAVRVGRGLLSRLPNDPGLFWTASALTAAGIGPFTRDELTRLSAGRRLGFGIGAGRDGVQFSAATSRGDIADTLHLMAGALTATRYAAPPIARLRDASEVSYRSYYSQPSSVLRAFGTAALYGGDRRFRGVPPLAEIERLDLPAFRRFWDAELKRGPVRVTAVGDFDSDALVAAVARSFGALPPRTPEPADPALAAITASAPPGNRVVLRHRGAADQAYVARVFPTLGLYRDVTASRALGFAANIAQDRLEEEFREKDAGTYAPTVYTSQSALLPDYGVLIAGAQLQVGRIADFDAALARILADLASKGPEPDALARARTTQIASIERSRADNGYWMGVLANDLTPDGLNSVRTAITGRQALTAEDIRAAAARYLVPARSFTISVLPEAAPTSPARP